MSITPHRRMALVGALQGAALWAISEGWSDSRTLSAILLGLVFFIATSALVVHMARTGARAGRLLALAGAIGVLFGAVSFWVGWQIPTGNDLPHDGDEARLVSWTFLSIVTLYVAMPFLQIYQRSGKVEFPYPDLYRFSWSNFFIASLGVLYAVALWVVLLLWAALFDLIGIELFQDLFSEPLFIFTVTGASLGYGIAAAHTSDHIIGTLRQVVRTLFQAIFPLLSGVTLIFIASLVFTGLGPLYETRRAAGILCSWIASGVLFFNAVYVDGSARPPYARSIVRLAEAGTIGMPVLGGIALHALFLRIGQYGLTPERLYGVIAGLVLSLYALGYAVAVLRRGLPWLPFVRRVNTSLAFVVMALGLALHTPLLDPLDWSLRSQLRRIERGVTDPGTFDYGFLRFELGHAGYEALLSLEKEAAAGSPAAHRIGLALQADNRWSWDAQQPVALHGDPLAALDGITPIPPGLVLALSARAKTLFGYAKCGNPDPCSAFQADIVRGGAAEWLVVPAPDSNLHLAVFTSDGEIPGRWRYAGGFSIREGGESWREERLPRLRAGDFGTEVPVFNDLVMGEHRYEFRPAR